MDDVMYFYDRAHDSKFSPEAVVYVTATESSFNPKAIYSQREQECKRTEVIALG